MLTSSMPGIVLTPSLFKVLCNLLSSVVVVLCTAFFFLNTKGSLSFLKKSHAKKKFSSLQNYNTKNACLSSSNHNSKTGKVKFAEKQENLQQQKQQLKPHNTELPRQSTAASNPKNTRATKEKKTKNSRRRRKEVDQNYIPSNATLAASADGTGHLHELFLVHGGQRWRVACARKRKLRTEKERSVAGERDEGNRPG
jgi:cell wall-associated NlpC family hydrolase